MHITKALFSLIAAAFCCSCIGTRPAAPSQPTGAEAIGQATIQIVLDDTVIEPTETVTPSPAPTTTPTASPTLPRPSLTPTKPIAACIQPGYQIQTGQVTSVIDGDTIRVSIDGQAYVVRYVGVNAPADLGIKDSIGSRSAVKNRELVEGKTITLVKGASDIDPYGRLLRYVFAGNTFVNNELIRLGLATAVTADPDADCYNAFLAAEHEANAQRAGLWSKPAPTKTPLGLGLQNASLVACDCVNAYLDCTDFQNQAAAQACYNYCKSENLGDVSDLDTDKDGVACNYLP